VIAPHASAHAKYWNNPGGWQAVINWLNAIGYKVVMLTSEKLGVDWQDAKLGGTLTGVIDKTGDISIHERMIDIRDADLFIGVGSGLSWLSWASGTPTVIISGFTDVDLEPLDGVTRVINKNVCNSCWSNHEFDPGNWNWCPIHEKTENQFECSKTITGGEVIEKLEKLLPI
jgi:autotransporter strand-loop-strand O-heptosyltransferase